MSTYVLGQPVPLTFQTYDTDGTLVSPTTAVLTITQWPGGASVTPTLDNPATGIYQVDFIPAAVGRHAAVFVSTGPGAGTAVDVFDILNPTASLVTIVEVMNYLTSTGETSFEMADIEEALEAERSAQANVCRVDDYSPALREALLRRVARNLAARAVPVASFSSFEGGTTSTRVPMRDAEVSRLEAPYKRLVVG